MTLSFDIGYASIGWCVLSANPGSADPDILGTGVVTFPTDDCLASKRRDLRRTRRHIRSTRQRIERMKGWLSHRGVLTREDLDRPGHPAPFLLAAAALQGHKTLTAWELWTVLRWYAHNRGYDGNSLWSARDEDETEDTEKLSNARAYMRKYDSVDELHKALGANAPETLMPEFHSMAETVCACLKLDPAKSNKTISSHLPYKTLNAAYPRATVQREVLALLQTHLGKINGLDGKTLDLLFTPESLSDEDRTFLKAADIELPNRYHGGLLFGQLIPRFDNRIISRCPITWAKAYDLVAEGLKGGEESGEKWHEFIVYASSENSRVDPEKSSIGWEKIVQAAMKLIGKGMEKGKAVHQIASNTADKFAKVPAAKSKEFLQYRFARILANLKADGKTIDKELRQQLFDLAEKQGRLSHSDLEKAVKQHCGDVPTNLEAYFKLHPDSEEALVLDPVMDEVRMAEGSRAMLSPFWKYLTAETRQAIIAEWKSGKAVSLSWIAGREGDNTELADAFLNKFKTLKPKKGEASYSTLNEYLQAARRKPKVPSGRGPYARPVLGQVVKEVREGFDPARSAEDDEDAKGNKKEKDGILYDLGIPGSRVRQLQDARPLDQLTNNHLVRHRMLILERLLDHLAEEFAIPEDPRIVVEVARELSKFSGMTAKQIASELKSRLKDFKSAVDYLEKAKVEVPGLEINGSIIRKCRIAMDLNWHCPFTGQNYGPDSLKALEREHIIPYSTRNTNALHALVLTWPQVNKMKGKRTARQFILDCGGEQVSGTHLSLMGIGEYDAFVAKLDSKGHPDDARRKRARKALLATTSFEDKELGFTDGALTQTSHLMKLAMRGLVRRFPKALCDPIPGPVTAEIRKAWDLTGTLALACPEVIDPKSGETLPKNDIRSLTHMHHALDAATIALAAHYFPLRSKGQDQKGKIWQILLKRNRSSPENDFLYGLGIFDRHRDKQGKNQVRLRDLPKEVKQALTHSLAQCRVSQHVPSDRSGAKTKMTTWGILEMENGKARLRQRGFVDDSGQPNLNPNKSRKRSDKEANPNGNGDDKNWLRVDKLLGPKPKNDLGKLKDIKGAMIIEENYGLALDPAPCVIPFHDVTARLAALRKANSGKSVRVLRNGMLVRVDNWQGKEGLWRIMSCKASMKLDLARPQETKASWREVSIISLMKRGLEILPQRYTGHPLNH